MAKSNSLGVLRETLTIAYSEDILDPVEYALLYDINKSREVYPHWKFDRFDFDLLDESQCKIDFRFEKNDLDLLLNVFQIPERIICTARYCLFWYGRTLYSVETLSFPLSLQ